MNWQPMSTAPKDGTEIIVCEMYILKYSYPHTGKKKHERVVTLDLLETPQVETVFWGWSGEGTSCKPWPKNQEEENALRDAWCISNSYGDEMGGWGTVRRPNCWMPKPAPPKPEEFPYDYPDIADVTS